VEEISIMAISPVAVTLVTWNARSHVRACLGSVLAQTVPDEFADVLSEGPEGVLEREVSILGTTHAKVGQRLLRLWKLPVGLCESTRFHHHGKIILGTDAPLTSHVALGDILATVYGDVYERSHADPVLTKLLKRVGLGPESVGGILDGMAPWAPPPGPPGPPCRSSC